jgi:hypothetical protein
LYVPAVLRFKIPHARNRSLSIRPDKLHHEGVNPRPVILRVTKLRCNIAEDRRKGFVNGHIDSAISSTIRSGGDQTAQVHLAVNQVFLLTIGLSVLQFVMIAAVWVNPQNCLLEFI